MKIICLVSGGVDSSLLLYMLKKDGNDIFPLYVDYGHKSAKMEIRSYLKICKQLKIQSCIIKCKDLGRISLSGLTNEKLSPITTPFVPGRNLLLLVIAAMYAYSKNAKIIATGFLNNPVFPDQSKKFVLETEKLLRLSFNYKVKVITPFIKLDKRAIIGLAKKHDFPLKLTYSCHSGRMKPCGVCTACKERRLAEKRPSL